MIQSFSYEQLHYTIVELPCKKSNRYKAKFITRYIHPLRGNGKIY